MASCFVVTAILSVLITTVATIVAFTTPNWVHYPTLSALSSVCDCKPFTSSCDCGLWLYCSNSQWGNENCRWYFDENYTIEKSLPVWYKAVQGLFAAAVISSLMALLIGLCSLCCFCRDCNPHQIANGLMNLTFLLLASAVCTFGAKCHLDHDVEVTKDVLLPTVIFGWSFWVAVAATGMSLLSSIIYFGVGRADTDRSI